MPVLRLDFEHSRASTIPCCWPETSRRAHLTSDCTRADATTIQRRTASESRPLHVLVNPFAGSYPEKDNLHVVVRLVVLMLLVTARKKG